MVINNKKGIIRIIEATIAIVLLIAVLVIMKPSSSVDSADYSQEIESVLEKISQNYTLRKNIVEDGSENVELELEAITEIEIGMAYLKSDVQICDSQEPCSLETSEIIEGEIYSGDRIISTYLGDSSEDLRSKKVKIYLWRI